MPLHFKSRNEATNYVVWQNGVRIGEYNDEGAARRSAELNSRRSGWAVTIDHGSREVARYVNGHQQ